MLYRTHVIISEYCDKCHVEPSFIDLLEDNGLIGVQEEEGVRCLLSDELPDIERYSRMYYDLSINMEGIDAIHHLLGQIERMQREIDELHRRLRFFGE